METLKNPEITQETILKLHREKSCYNGFAWIGVKEIVGIDNVETTMINATQKYYLVIYKHLITGFIYGTPVRVTSDKGGLGYSTLIDKTTRLTDLELTT